VLDDGTLVLVHTARKYDHDNNPATAELQTAGSGVYRLDPGASQWTDVTGTNMHYWCKDLIVDPHDPTQSTWYVGVANAIQPVEFVSGLPSNKPGLYMTTDRGQTWTRVFDKDTDSITVDPSNPSEAYLATNSDGLWYTSDLRLADGVTINPAPTFTQVSSFPHQRANRVFFNPYVPGEVWVASNGGGIFVGNASQPLRTFDFSGANYAANEIDGTATVTVTRSGDTANSMSVDYIVSAGSAVSGFDFAATNLPTGITGTLTFLPGQASVSFAVSILDDSLIEGPETVLLALAGPIGGNVLGATSTAALTISDDEPLPQLAIDDATLVEGDAGTTSAAFTVSLSAASTLPVTVDFATADGSASDPSDYSATNGRLTIPAGSTTATITVTVNGDATVETDESFFVNLTGPTNAAVADGQGLASIVNDDAWPPDPAPTVADVRVHFGSQTVSILGLGRTLPWVNIDAIDIVFSEGVIVDIGDLQLTGINVSSYSFRGFSYDSATFTARWDLTTALAVDRLLMTLDGDDDANDGNAGVTDLPAFGTPSFLSSGDYLLNFDVLPGDFTGDGRVNKTDVSKVRKQIGIWSLYADLDGDGDVDDQDVTLVRQHLHNRLP
jgi:hypothetical protein